MISTILSIWSLLRQRPILHVRDRSISVLSESDGTNYYGFVITNRGFKATSIRNVCALPKGGRGIIAVPIDCLDNGQDVKTVVLSKRFLAMNNNGHRLGPGEEKVFVLEKTQDVERCRFFSTYSNKAITKKINQNGTYIQKCRRWWVIEQKWSVKSGQFFPCI